MLRSWGNKLTACAIALLLPAATAFGAIAEGAPDDWMPSLVYDPSDGSLSIDTGAGFGGPSVIYYVTVYSDYGIFNPIHASPVVWYAYDTEITTLPTAPLYTGTVIGDPGFMYKNEQLSFLLNDLTFIWQDDPSGNAYYGDLVYVSDTPELPGDQNGDGFVGIADLNIILGDWNKTVPPASEMADPSGDNYVGIADLNIVLGNWNAGTPPAANAVPEPGTAALLALAFGTGLSRRARK